LIQHLNFRIGDIKLFISNALNIIQKVYPQFDYHDLDNNLRDFLQELRDDIYVLIEYPYVDKAFRDSYYLHYSSRHEAFPRDTVRVSLFSVKISNDIFKPNFNYSKLLNEYLGFFIIRPTKSSMLGRNYINPKAFKKNNFVTCLCRITTSLFGIPFFVDAFPHSTQDRIVSTCAETSVWSIMEYFGNKYTEYSPVLTSKITKVINDTFYQRSLPSNGLTALQISSALKAFGFSTRIYSKKSKGGDLEEKILFRTISDYVESGIPVVIAVTGENVGGHAFLLTGHAEIDLDSLVIPDKVYSTDNEYSFKIDDKNVNIFDSADFSKLYISVDDNQKVYSPIDLKKPLEGYIDSRFHSCEIKSAIVPLQNRIYMESKIARRLAIELFKDRIYGIKLEELNSLDERWIFRLLLTSARSLKKSLRRIHQSGDPNVSEWLLKSHFPRFLWIAEFARESIFRTEQVEVRYILDATGDESPNSLLFAQFPKRFAFFKGKKNDVDWLSSEKEKFDLYRNNLKGKWNQWNSN
jgi:hypothetical protein